MKLRRLYTFSPLFSVVGILILGSYDNPQSPERSVASISPIETQELVKKPSQYQFPTHMVGRLIQKLMAGDLQNTMDDDEYALNIKTLQDYNGTASMILISYYRSLGVSEFNKKFFAIDLISELSHPDSIALFKEILLTPDAEISNMYTDQLGILKQASIVGLEHISIKTDQDVSPLLYFSLNNDKNDAVKIAAIKSLMNLGENPMETKEEIKKNSNSELAPMIEEVALGKTTDAVENMREDLRVKVQNIVKDLSL